MQASSSRLGAGKGGAESARRPGASHGPGGPPDSPIAVPLARPNRCTGATGRPASLLRRLCPRLPPARSLLFAARRCVSQAAMAARLTALWSKARAAAEPAVKVASKEVASRYEQMMAANAQVGFGNSSAGGRQPAQLATTLCRAAAAQLLPAPLRLLLAVLTAWRALPLRLPCLPRRCLRAAGQVPIGPALLLL